jgi:hypothetical protein
MFVRFASDAIVLLDGAKQGARRPGPSVQKKSLMVYTILRLPKEEQYKN